MPGLLDLPVEVQVMIFEQLMPNHLHAGGNNGWPGFYDRRKHASLADLARSCQRLNAVATPLLYRTLHITERCQAAQLLSTLLANRQLAEHVHNLTCTKEHNIPDEGQGIWRLFMKQVQQSLTTTTTTTTNMPAFTCMPTILKAYALFPGRVYGPKGTQRSYFGDALLIILLLTHRIELARLSYRRRDELGRLCQRTYLERAWEPSTSLTADLGIDIATLFSSHWAGTRY